MDQTRHIEREKFPHLNRRGFIFSAGAALAGLTLADFGSFHGGVTTAQKYPTDPFTLGVASGDPAPDGVVLWTRLAPDPLRADGTGGMPPRATPVEWEVATDELMLNVVQRGAVLARPELAHSVHVELSGLEPAHWYWYRFRSGDTPSRVGRTKTAPDAGVAVDQLRFAFVSCQAWQDGFYIAYREMAEKEDLDFVVHLGDYIYEGGINSAGPRGALPPDHVRPEITNINQYRWRHSLYKLDPNLQAAHASFPFIVTWDDHEVENNYAALIRENNNPPGDFVQRRTDAYQAYYEHQPLRAAQLPTGPDLPLYRRLTFGALAEFNVLDTRQYRTDQPCGDGTRVPCAERDNPDATLLGAAQEGWLFDGLGNSAARWNVLAQQIFVARRDFTVGADATYSMDVWDGYPAARGRLFDKLAELSNQRPLNPVALTGDVHSNWVADLKADFDDPSSPTLGTEFVGTSITTGGNGAETTAGGTNARTENSHIKFYNNRRGYVRCTLTPELWRTDYRILPVVNTPDVSIFTRASFVVESGSAGALTSLAGDSTESFVIEGETLLPPLEASAPAVVQANVVGFSWSNGYQLWFRAVAAGDYFTVVFYVTEGGNYDVAALFTKAADYGVVRLAVDDQIIGAEFDGYNAAGVISERAAFGPIGLGRGRHVLKLTVIGKNAEATGFFAGIDLLDFKPLG